MEHRLQTDLERGQWTDSGKLGNTPSGYLLGWGTTVGNSVEGWAYGAIFVHHDGSGSSDAVYKNIGTTTTANWAEVSASAAVPDSLDLGSSGNAGDLDIFPSTASKGKLTISAADSAGDTATTITNASQAAARTYTIPDAGAAAEFCLLTTSQTTAGQLKRADLTQETLVVHPVNFAELKTWDNYAVDLPAAAAADDLGVIMGTFGTDAVQVQAGDLKAAGATNRYAGFSFNVPPHYDAAETITLRVNAGMTTTVSDTTCTLDAEVYRIAAPSTDICATAAQDMNSLTPANLDFTVTPTNVVVGDILYIRLTVACNDGATGTAVIPTIFSISLLMDSKG